MKGSGKVMGERLEITWPRITAVSAPIDREIHVWAAELDPGEERLADYAHTLATDERERAARFHAVRDRRRFTVARGFLRAVLSQCVGRKPEEVNFNYETRGKPALANDPLLHFNLSHSGELALLVVTRFAPVGIDVELIRPVRDAMAIAERFFSPQESGGLAAAPEADQPAAFFNLWTRKEAWLKTTGEGISNSLNRVEVSFLPGEPARLVSLHGDAARAGEWTLMELAPALGYVGALAFKARNAAVRLARWG